MKKFRDYLVDKYAEYCGELFTKEDIERQIRTAEISPKNKRKVYGEFSLPMFEFAKAVYQEKESKKLAEEVAQELELDANLIEKVETIGPFINFYVNKKTLVQTVLDEVKEQGEQYGSSNQGEGKTIIIDYSAPNLGKPLHVGHIRSTILGDSLIRTLKFAGYKTHGINYLGDIGLHMGKVIAAYKRWGDEQKIRANPEKEILNLYVGFCKEEAKHQTDDEERKNNPVLQEAKKALELLEAEDPESVKIWEFIAEMSHTAFDRVYSALDVEFDEVTGQSKFSDLGMAFVQEALDLGKAKKSEDGAIKMDLTEYNLPDKVILRSDGTAIYSTQDLGSARFRKEKYDFDKMMYIVASEQALYFKQLFASLDKMGYEWSKDCEHISFGMIHLAEGKMSTREGAIVYLEEVLDKAVDMAYKIIENKNPDLENKNEIAKMVGIGAIKYMVLGIDYVKDMEFSWDRALSFEGNSAPYIQYSHARASSILRKADYEPQNFNPEDFSELEVELIKKIGEFSLITESVAKSHKQHVIANYAYDLATMFNNFYRNEKVLGSGEKEESKLALVDAFRTTTKNALGLLGIKVPEEM